MKQLKDFAAKLEEIRAAAITGALDVHGDASIDSPRAWGHDEYAVTHVDRFIDVMSDQEHRGETGLPQAQHFILHSHAREGKRPVSSEGGHPMQIPLNKPDATPSA
jgi:hypothetical protein